MMTLAHDHEVARRFDAVAARFKAEVADDDYRLAALGRNLAASESPTILDLGCGKGRFARQLMRRGARVVGLDLSPRMLDEAAGLPRVQGTARSLPFGDACFDAAIAVESLEHVGDVAGVIREARRVLKPGGRLIVVDKNRGALDARRPWLPSVVVKWIDERRGLWMYPADGPVRETWFGPGRLGRMLKKSFDHVSVEFLLSPHEAARSLFRLVPATRLMACWTATAGGLR